MYTDGQQGNSDHVFTTWSLTLTELTLFRFRSSLRHMLTLSPSCLVVTEYIQKFLNVYKEKGPKEFWQRLMKRGDKFTVRQFLAER